MRNYSKMTDEEFIKAYETPYTPHEREERHKIAKQQIAEGKGYTLEEIIDEVFVDD